MIAGIANRATLIVGLADLFTPEARGEVHIWGGTVKVFASPHTNKMMVTIGQDPPQELYFDTECDALKASYDGVQLKIAGSYQYDNATWVEPVFIYDIYHSAKEPWEVVSGNLISFEVNDPPVLSYDANGGYGFINESAGNDIRIAVDGFTRKGYALVGWNAAANGSGTSYALGETITISADTTVYAVWEKVGGVPTDPDRPIDMDWSGDRSDSYEFYRLRYPNLDAEIERIEGIEGGQIDEDAESDLFSSASLSYAGDPKLADDDIVRIYYTAESGGASERVVLFTGFATLPSSTTSSAAAKGKVNLHSMLSVLKEDAVSSVYQVPKTTNAIVAAAQIVSDCGLSVVAQASLAETTEAKTFDAGTSKLVIVQWLCEFAGFDKPYTNEFGEVILASKTEEGSPVTTFTDDNRSIILPEVSIERNAERVPNVVKAIYTAASSTLSAEALNEDAGSPYSIQNRGRRVVHVLTVSDVKGVSNAVKQAELEKQAVEELKRLTGKGQVVNFTHAYVPFYRLNQSVRLNYEGAGFDFTGRAVSRTIELGAGAMTSVKLKSGGDQVGTAD